MSPSHPLHSAPSSRHGEVWTRVDAGVYRGSRDGRALGDVHTVVAGWVAVDPSGTPVGRYASRDEARRALRSLPAHRAAARAENAVAGRVGVTAATVLGGVALVGALTAAAVAPWL